MKSTRIRLLLMLTAIFLAGNLYAQEKEEKMFQMYEVHEDQVKPSMVMQYEATAKMLADKLKEHKIDVGGYLTTNTDNFRYLFVSPVEDMSEVGKNPEMAALSEKMGTEAFSKMMDGFDPCYDRHGSYLIWLDKALSYMPTGITQTPEGKDYRKFYYIYYAPQNRSKMLEAMEGVKELFERKNSTSYYRVYHSGFGNMDSYIMVAIAAKDAVEMEQNAAANEKLLGEDAGPVYSKVLNLALKMEEYTGQIRPDLGFSPPKN